MGRKGTGCGKKDCISAGPRCGKDVCPLQVGEGAAGDNIFFNFLVSAAAYATAIYGTYWGQMCKYRPLNKKHPHELSLAGMLICFSLISTCCRAMWFILQVAKSFIYPILGPDAHTATVRANYLLLIAACVERYSGRTAWTTAPYPANCLAYEPEDSFPPFMTLHIGHEQANEYRRAIGRYVRKVQWTDLTVDVYL